MRGLKSEDLIAVVDFLYYGEANIYQESLDAFLTIAEELNLKGLNGGDKVESESLTESLHETFAEEPALSQARITHQWIPQISIFLNLALRRIRVLRG